MFWTRNWGYVSSREELAMLNRAERHMKELERESVRSNKNSSKHH